jgi:hypothetical protein
MTTIFAGEILRVFSRARPGEREGYVYFARPVGTQGIYKIGCSLDTAKRYERFVRDRDRDYELESYVEFYTEDYISVEQELQRLFRPKYLIGEWFVIELGTLEEVHKAWATRRNNRGS